MEVVMKIGQWIVRLFLGWIALVGAQMAAGMVIHVNAPPMPHVLPWLMASDAIVVLALGSAAMCSGWKGWKLGLALFSIPAAIAIVNMIEGIIFLTGSHIDWRGTITITLVGYAIATALWAFIFSGNVSTESAESWSFPERNVVQKLWRFVFCSAAYVFLYYLAGMIIFPYVRDFYATQHIPSFGQIVLLQFFFRGPVFVLVCLLLFL